MPSASRARTAAPRRSATALARPRRPRASPLRAPKHLLISRYARARAGCVLQPAHARPPWRGDFHTECESKGRLARPGAELARRAPLRRAPGGDSRAAAERGTALRNAVRDVLTPHFTSPFSRRHAPPKVATHRGGPTTRGGANAARGTSPRVVSRRGSSDGVSYVKPHTSDEWALVRNRLWQAWSVSAFGLGGFAS